MILTLKLNWFVRKPVYSEAITIIRVIRVIRVIRLLERLLILIIT